MYLLARTREGSDEAYAELWRRHLPAAYAVANRYQPNGHAEDVVAEAATRVLALLKDGRGPEENFRSYFLTAIRSVAVDAGRRDDKVVPTPAEDLDELMDPMVEPHDDDGFDPELVREAFRRLPERDQRVLWHTTVEGEAPRVVGPALGMSANAVSVRAMRAREALRVGYLQAHAAQHLAAAESAECRWAIGVLADHVRGHLPKRASDRLKEHLAGCEHDRAVQTQLRSLHDRFPALVVPLVFLAGASTPGFLGGALFAGAAGAGVVGSELAGAEPTGPGPSHPEPAGVDAGAPGAEPAAVAQGGPDRVSGLAGKVAAVAAGVVIAAGVLGAASSPVGPVAAHPPTSASTSSSSSTATTSSAAPTTSTSATPSTTATLALPATSTSTTKAATVTRSSAVQVTAAPSPSPRPAPPSGSHTVEMRIVSSGTPTRFSLRFDSAVGGTLRVTVSNKSGTGRLTAENGAFTCTNTSRSSVRCSGRTGQLMLSQSGLSRPDPVVVRVTDSTGATSIRTFSLR